MRHVLPHPKMLPTSSLVALTHRLVRSSSDQSVGERGLDVFDFDRRLVDDYERLARSFTKILAPDIATKVSEIYADGRFWPEPLVSVNPTSSLARPSTRWSRAGGSIPTPPGSSGLPKARSGSTVISSRRRARQSLGAATLSRPARVLANRCAFLCPSTTRPSARAPREKGAGPEPSSST